MTALDDYLFALQASTQAASEEAELLADYNTEIARLQEIEGTLLDKYNIHLLNDPCNNRILNTLPEIPVPAPPIVPEIIETPEAEGAGVTLPPGSDEATLRLESEDAKTLEFPNVTGESDVAATP